jgi:hypothetical protein
MRSALICLLERSASYRRGYLRKHRSVNLPWG